jgi:hypothetical protein
MKTADWDSNRQLPELLQMTRPLHGEYQSVQPVFGNMMLLHEHCVTRNIA